ncbi:hypothetical protein HHK36_023120 [Tetracentron sinense]|uniref:Proteasome assembly chaperone 1 n=1 Tax=Tetracentron sinense TaxID=13715 RepID=A0A834YPW3_TETSI|nr:hypothetical protein HHK36_023120 [Tetracentron sinense]
MEGPNNPRFFEEDLNSFTSPSESPNLPSPFLLFSNPNSDFPLRPSLLILAISSPSLSIFHHLSSSKTLIGTLILPEISFSGNSIQPSLSDKSCNIYALQDHSTLLVSVQCSVASDRSHAVAKLLIGGSQISPDKVLIFDSVQSRNFRGKLSPGDSFAYKLETSSERNGVCTLKGLEPFPSGSMIEGLGAAILARCQMKKMKGALCVSWPDSGGFGVSSLLKSLLLKDVLPDLNLSLDLDDEDGLWTGRDSHLDSELYT